MKQLVTDAYNYASGWLGQGNAATFIPELTKADPNRLGICITTVDGQQYAIGNCEDKFTIQSISKIFMLAAAIEDAGYEEVFSRIGYEDRGEEFNSIYKMEIMDPHPSNPLLNAGAICTSSLIKGKTVEEKYGKLFDLAAKCMGVDKVESANDVFNCEMTTGFRNRVLAQIMDDAGLLGSSQEDALIIYFRGCSMMVDCKMLSRFGAVLAGGGKDPITGEQYFKPETARLLRTLMAGCGMYTKSGEYAVRVGLPSKSGSGGGICTAVPGKMGIGTFSPLLDASGNSLCGVKAMEYLSDKADLCIY